MARRRWAWSWVMAVGEGGGRAVFSGICRGLRPGGPGSSTVRTGGGPGEEPEGSMLAVLHILFALGSTSGGKVMPSGSEEAWLEFDRRVAAVAVGSAAAGGAGVVRGDPKARDSRGSVGPRGSESEAEFTADSAADFSGRASPAWPKSAPSSTSLYFRILLQLVAAAGEGGAFEVGGEDPLGVQVSRMRFGLGGEFGDWDWKISTRFRNGETRNPTAWFRRPLGEDFTLRVGSQKAPFLHGALVSRTRLAFNERSSLGARWAPRDFGARLDGSIDALFGMNWALGALVGDSGAGNGWLTTGRATWDLVGEGFPSGEVPQGPGAAPRLGLALAVADEGSLSQGTLWAVELAGSTAHWYGHVTVLHAGDDLVAGSLGSGAARRSAGLAGLTPVDLTLVRGLTGSWSLGARASILDDDFGSREYILGLRRGFDFDGANLYIDWTERESDDPDLEGRQFAIGLTLSS